MGFIPARDKLYSTNGEVHVDLKDGVKYVLRFGDIAGVQAGSDGQKLNRFLLVNAELTDDMKQPPMLEPEPAGPEAPSTTPPPPTTPPAAEAPKPNGGACQEEGKKEETKEEPKAGATKTKAKGDDKSGTAKTEPSTTKAKAARSLPPSPPKPPPSRTLPRWSSTASRRPTSGRRMNTT